MRPRSWLLLIAVPLVLWVLGVVVQVVLSPADYDALSNAWTFFLVLGLVALVGLIWSAGGRYRRTMRALSRDHPDSLVQLAAVSDKGERSVTAVVLVEPGGIGFSSKLGSLRRLMWSQVQSVTTIPWGETIRTGLEITTAGESIRLMPISAATLLPVSGRRADAFFDATKEAWRLHKTLTPPQPGSEAPTGAAPVRPQE